MIECEIMDPVELMHLSADLHGYEEQSQQCMEELAECIAAINHYRRAKRLKDPVERLTVYGELVDEMADALNMLVQMIYLLDCHAEVEANLNQKVLREVERMKKAGLLNDKPVSMEPLLNVFMRDSLV